MKRKFLLFLTLPLLLSGCNLNHTHVDENNDHICDSCGKEFSSHIDSDNNHICDICNDIVTYCADNNNDHKCDICNEPLSRCRDNNNDGYCDICHASMQEGNNVATIELYGINDLHGAVTTEIGLINLGTYMKSKTDQINTLFIDSGDTWQGSVESNVNKGNLITDVFSYARLSARTIGNHDFDWGLDALRANTARSYNDYTIPTLGANIYDYNFETKKVGNTQQSDLGKEYVIYTLENGLKVGIIGVIGKSQITSISTDKVKNIIFTNHISKIKELSDELRVNKGCDVIIASEHDGFSYEEIELTYISPVSNKKYVDFVFNGHTHQNECYNENGVYFAQCGADGDAVGHATLKYNLITEEITTSYEVFNTNEVIREVNTIGQDPTIVSIVNDYARVSDPIGSRVLSTKMSGTFDRDEELVNLMCEAVYQECVAENIDVDFTYCNDARTDIYAHLNGEVTYKDIFKAFPFDNVVYIISIKGEACLNELVTYNCVYNTGINSVYTNNTYKIAALDYLAFHSNSNRQYDYFPGAISLDYLKKADGSPYYYRDILADYLESHPNKCFYASNYSSSETKFSKPSFY